MERRCPYCLTLFSTSNNSQKFCNVKCRTAYNNGKKAGKDTPERPPVKSLAEMQREALEHGMSYGKYMLMQEQAKQKSGDGQSCRKISGKLLRERVFDSADDKSIV